MPKLGQVSGKHFPDINLVINIFGYGILDLKKKI